MEKQLLHGMQDRPDRGKLKVNVITQGRLEPVSNAKVKISYSGDPNSSVEELSTNISGITPTIDLATPPIDYSLAPSEQQPYAEYTIAVSAPGYETMTISGAQLLADVTALQQIKLRPVQENQTPDNSVIAAHTLYATYPPKIAEAEVKPVSDFGEIVLSKVVVPEIVVVHDGSPTDSTATDYYVPYKDYIKNVASSEIYATWPEETIYANVLAIMSFTLNRVYTEWYRNKGFNFTITSSTAFDHKWIPDRNIFDNISRIVDTVFTNYLSRPNVKQPILTQYCDGERVKCPKWMSQWGSKDLGVEGLSAIEIIRTYYGDNMYINEAEEVAGIPSSWPGADLTIGSTGEKVLQMQEQLNRIADTYTAVHHISADGEFGPDTAEAVKEFQKIFDLPETGIVDYPTWFKIQAIYVALTRIAELS